MFDGIAFALLGAFSITICSLASRAMMRGEKDTWAATAANETVGSVMLLAIIAAFGVGFLAPENFDFAAVPQEAWLAMLASAIIFVVVMYATYESYKHLDAGEIRTLMQLMQPLVILLALPVFGEMPGIWQWAGIALILSGVYVATYGTKLHDIKNIGVRFVLLTVAGFVVTSLIDKYAIDYFPPLVYALPMFAFPAGVACAIAIRGRGVSKVVSFAKRRAHLVLAVAITNITGYFGVIMAFRLMPLSIASPIISTNVVFTVAAGALLLGEKDGFAQKVAGAALALAGLALVSL